MTNVFRGLVVASFLLVMIVELVAWYYVPDDPELVNFLSLNGEGALFLVNWPLYIFIIFVDLILTAALLSFHPWSRTLFFLLICAHLLLTFVWGYRVATPLESFFAYLQSLVDGAIIAIAYFTSVSAKFERGAA